MAVIDRWLHYTVTTIDRFHCITLLHSLRVWLTVCVMLVCVMLLCKQRCSGSHYTTIIRFIIL